MPNINLNGFLKGLRPTEHSEGCTEFQNLQPMFGQVLWSQEHLTDLPAALLAEFTAHSITDAWPFPQIIHGKSLSFVGTATKLFTMDRDTYALEEINPYLIDDLTTQPGITSGGTWHVADFGNVVFLTNGNCAVFKFATLASDSDFSADYYIDTTFYPKTLCNFKGRLLMGGFGDASYHADWESLYDALRGADLDGLATLPPLKAGHVWWSSLTGEDFFQWFYPDSVLDMQPMDDPNRYALTEGEFDANTNWTEGTNWLIGLGALVRTSGFFPTNTIQVNADMAVPMKGGQIYRVEINVSSINTGNFTVTFDDQVITLTAAGTTVHYITPTNDPDCYITCSSSSVAGSITYIRVTPINLQPFFDLQDQGQMGHKYLDDSVLCMAPVGDTLVVYTDDKVWQAVAVGSEITPTLGWQVISDVGIADRGHVAAGRFFHVFRGADGYAYRVTQKGAEKLGFYEQLETLDAVHGIVDERFQTAYLGGTVSGEPRSLQVTMEGAGWCTYTISGGFEQDGLFYTNRIEDTGTDAPNLFSLQTNDLALPPGKTNIEFVDIRAFKTDAMKFRARVRDDRDGESYIDYPHADGALVNKHGRSYVRTNAREMRLKWTGTAQLGMNIKDILANGRNIRR